MIVHENKGYQTNSLYPNSDWTGEAKYTIKDDSDLANKIINLYPYYDFVLDKEGKLIDVVAIEKPSTPVPTEEENQTRYNELSIKYIHEKYTYDDENKIIREYLTDVTSVVYKEAFEAYNDYVIECKQKAYKEIYGE